MKRLKSILLILLIIPCVFMLNACSTSFNTHFVVGIEQTETVGNTTSYTIYYSDGTSSILTVKDGQDGSNLTIQAIKDYCTAENVDFDSFLKEYLTIVNKTPTVKDASNFAIQSAVNVYAEHCEKPDYYDNKELSISCGAGVIFEMGDEFSYVITNYHVVYYKDSVSANKIGRKITLFQYGTSDTVYKSSTTDTDGYPISVYGDGAVDAEFVGGAMNYDLAVLRVKTADLLKYNPNACAVTLADNYYIGDTAIAIGNPANEGFSVTSGIVSVVHEEITMTGVDEITTCTFRVLRVDTAINGGNSGGGLFNIDGHLIGIVNAKTVATEIENMAYALPVDNVKAVVNNLIYYYELNGSASQVKTLNLNIVTEAQNMRAVYNKDKNETVLTEDIVVTSISSGLGNKLGIQIDDQILSLTINSTKYEFKKEYQLYEALLNVRPNDKIILELDRKGSKVNVGVTSSEGVSATYFVTVI